MPPSKFLQVFKDATQSNDFNEVIHLLNDKKTNPTVGDNYALIWCCKNGNLSILDLLLRHHRINLYYHGDRALSNAIGNECCHLHIVDRLLHDYNTNHIHIDSCILQHAYCVDHFEAAELIIKHPFFVPSHHNIIEASEKGHFNGVEWLLKDSRVDPTFENNHAISNACKNGHLSIVELLLNDPRVDPSDNNNWCIQTASLNNHLSIVERLVKDPRVDPTVNKNKVIRQACYYGHLSIVEFLLKDPRVAKLIDERVEYLEKKTVNELKEICKQYTIAFSGLSKEDLIDRLKFVDETEDSDDTKSFFSIYKRDRKW